MKRAGYSPWVCKKLDTTERLSLSLLGFPESQLVKNPPAIHLQETPVRFLRWEDPQEKEEIPTPVIWPGEFHGLYSP